MINDKKHLVRKFIERLDYSYSYKTVNERENVIKDICEIAGVKQFKIPFFSDGVNKPPLGLTPRAFYKLESKSERFNQVRGAILRYYNCGLKIKTEWIEEYNCLVDKIGKTLTEKHLERQTKK